MDIKNESLGPARIREIRLAADMTQEQFASEIKVGKVTVARWELGSRQCRGEYAKRVKKFASEKAKHLIRTTTVFEVRRHQLSVLDSTQAVETFRNLIWSELRRVKIPSTQVRIGTREIADGGIDAVVPSSKKLAESDSFLTGGENHFQIKAGTSWSPWQKSFAKKELLGKNKKLGTAVRDCLSNEGKYILVCFGNDLTPEQRKSAKQNLATIFAGEGYENANVDVWGQQELLGHLQRFPFLSLQLAGRDSFQFQSWSSWQLSNEMSNCLELGEEQKRLRDEIRRLINDEKVSHIRIIGEPGLGKTRLVLESLARDGLAQHVVYVAHAEDFQKSHLYHDILHPDADYSLILVLDECRPRECSEIWDRLSNHSDRCKVISIDHDTFHPHDDRFVELECPKLESEKIEAIIDSYTAGGRRWVEFCSGVPRVAHAIGQNLKANPDDLLKSPSMNLIWDRFISGYRSIESEEAKEKLIVLRYIALFHRFGFESPVDSEGKFISELIHRDHGISYAQFQMVVEELKRQRILQGKVTLFIAPKLLHVHLWTQFWEFYGRDKSIGELFKQVPEKLKSWFVRMFPYADESPVASKQVEKFLGPDGPFNDTEFAFSASGCRFLHKLSNASPKHAISCLERVFKQATSDELKSLDRRRQDIIWALERTAAWPQFFCRSAMLLRRLAEFENSNSSNNATGTFVGLFCPAPGRIAPTGASPSTRLPVLEETLNETSDEVRRLGIKACMTALNTRPGTQIIGHEYQGLKTVPMWTPETWGEVYHAMADVWDVLFESTRGWRNLIRSEANASLIEAGFRLLGNSTLCDRVLNALESLVDDDATDHELLVKAITGIRRHINTDKKQYSDEVVQRIFTIDETIAGASFSDRVQRIVHWSGWDDQYDGNAKNHDKFNASVRDLAVEATRLEDEFLELLPGLVIGTNNVIFQFGREIANIDQGKFLNNIIEGYRNGSGSVSALFISGYLTSVFENDQTKWKTVIEAILSDELFRPIICLIVRNSGATDEIVSKIFEQYDSGNLDINCLMSFGFSRHLTSLSEDVFLGFVRRLVDAGEVAYAVGLFSVVYCDKKNPKDLPKTETMALLRAFGKPEAQKQECDYQWCEVAKAFVKQFPDRRKALFEIVLDRVEFRDQHLFPNDYSSAVIDPIIQSNPRQYWDALSSRIDAAEGLPRYYLLDWLAPDMSMGAGIETGRLMLFPMDAVFEWIDRDPESRAYELVRSVPKSLALDEVGAWARELLNRYGTQDDVRLGLLSHFWAGGWSGNLSDRYRMLRETARGWLDEETSLRIRDWLEEFIDWLSGDIERAEIEEERAY